MADEPKSREAIEAGLSKLRADIMSLPPAERIRLAADLMEERHPKIALMILRGIVSDMTELESAGAF